VQVELDCALTGQLGEVALAVERLIPICSEIGRSRASALR
jgi:hypothetical protein